MKKTSVDIFSQAYQLQSQGQLIKAINLYLDVLALEPDFPDCLHYLGLAYAQQNDYTNALLFLGQALEANDQDVALLNNLANVYKNQKQWDKAIQLYEKALAIDPHYAQAHNNLATVYALQQNYTKALIHYKEAVHAAPDFASAHFNLGLLLFQHKNYPAALTQFTNVLSLNPENVEAYFYSGLLYLEKSDLDKAEQAFQVSMEQESLQVESLTNLGVIALKRQTPQEAIDYFSKALALDNGHVVARNNLAATFMHHDRFENALSHYKQLLAADPQNVEYLYNAGVAQMTLGHLEEAKVYLQTLLSIESMHGFALNNMAAIYLKLDDKERAQSYLKQALVVNPEDEISKHMLRALTGDAEEAASTPAYARNLFNNYALNYDKHMQETLHYSIPQHIGRLLHQFALLQMPATLDLGCGTGLTGVVLREVSKQLVGVDIAPKMLAQAKAKGLYDDLIESELTVFLQGQHKAHDLVVAADVLPYLGDLDPLFQAISQSLKPGGYFVFTTEISPDKSYTLQVCARFSHHENYIKKLIAQNHLELVHQEKIQARLQNQILLDAMLYVVKGVD